MQRMINQPQWPNGNEPTMITSIVGGFVDGAKASHKKPKNANAAIKMADGWYWCKKLR